MNSERLIFIARLTIAAVLGYFLLSYGKRAVAGGDIGSAFFVAALLALYGIVLFLLFGSSVMGKVADQFGNLYMPSDHGIQISPEYSVAEACVKKGNYQEAVDEY